MSKVGGVGATKHMAINQEDGAMGRGNLTMQRDTW